MRNLKRYFPLILLLGIGIFVLILVFGGFQGNDTQYFLSGSKEALSGNAKLAGLNESLRYLVSSVVVLCALGIAWCIYRSKHKPF
jgi:hypothetical protein